MGTAAPPPDRAVAHREWLDHVATDPVPPDWSSGQYCTAHADDGAPCQRELNHEGVHDFAVQKGTPVDGGQRWSHWIRVVHAARALLLDEPATPDRPYRRGTIGTPNDTHLLAQLTGLLGLIPEDTHDDGSVTIREP